MKIPINIIVIPEPTEHVDEEQLQELAESIREQGMSHKIIVRQPNDSQGHSLSSEPCTGCNDPLGCRLLGTYILVSGEKRLLAHMKLGLVEIEAELRDVDEKKAKEIRLHENLKRFNLPWWEQVILVEELHKLRQQEHGPAPSGRPSKAEGKTGWSIRDTAEELGMGVGSLSEDLTLARAIRSDSSLMKVTDKKTAVRLVRIAATRLQAEHDAALPSSIEGNLIFFGDSASVLSQLPANSIDHCITDPPWIKFFDASLRIDERTLPVFKELYRVLKHGAFLYLFCGLDDYAYYSGVNVPNPDNPNETLHQRGELEKIGFQVSNTPVIWQKENALSRRGVRAWEYDRDFEFIIVAVKGSPALTTSRRLSGIKPFPIVPPPKMIHPNEKPISILEDIITDCSYEGNIIIDPFAGSGALGEACKKNKRKYILCERDQKAYEKIKTRLEAK